MTLTTPLSHVNMLLTCMFVDSLWFLVVPLVPEDHPDPANPEKDKNTRDHTAERLSQHDEQQHT